MNNVEKLFKEKTKEIRFIEIKENKNIDVNGYLIRTGLPLPVIADNLLKDLQYSDTTDEIKLRQVIDGIIFLLGTDPDFPYVQNYKEILFKYDKKIMDYIFYIGMKALEDGDLENSGVFFRSNIVLDSKNLNARLNYGLVLESIGKRYIETDKLEDSEEFLLKSTNELESILDIDDSYSLAYYKLGYHYKYFEQYLKAKITWNKFLLLDKDEDRLQEIREQIEIIDDDVNLETGLSYLAYNDFGKALDLFLKLVPKHKGNWQINYLIGLGYKGIEEYDSAMEYFNIALELNKVEPDIYNELGIVYFVQGKILEAIEIFNEGINECMEDYKLYFNRGLGYVQLGEYLLALVDITRAYELNPSDQNISIQKEEIENLLKSI